jgi:hypothetical protein
VFFGGIIKENASLQNKLTSDGHKGIQSLMAITCGNVKVTDFITLWDLLIAYILFIINENFCLVKIIFQQKFAMEKPKGKDQIILLERNNNNKRKKKKKGNTIHDWLLNGRWKIFQSSRFKFDMKGVGPTFGRTNLTGLAWMSWCKHYECVHHQSSKLYTDATVWARQQGRDYNS